MKMLPDGLYDRIVAALRMMSATCRQCLRPKDLCASCDIRSITIVLEELDRTKAVTAKDCEVRYAAITEEIRKAGRPLMSYEIDCGKRLCGRTKKGWTLRKMVRLGILKKTKNNKRYVYSLGENAK